MPTFEDDEVVGLRGNRRGRGLNTDIDPVVDTTGETLALRFEEFLEEYVCRKLAQSGTNDDADIRKTQPQNLRPHRVRRPAIATMLSK